MQGQCDGLMLKMPKIIRINGLCCICHDILNNSKIKQTSKPKKTLLYNCLNRKAQ